MSFFNTKSKKTNTNYIIKVIKMPLITICINIVVIIFINLTFYGPKNMSIFIFIKLSDKNVNILCFIAKIKSVLTASICFKSIELK